MTEGRRSARLRDPAANRQEAEEQPASNTPKGSRRTKGRNKEKGTDILSVEQPAKEKTPEKIDTIILPVKLVESQPLPCLPSPQPKELSDVEWQSIGESGVLVASLPRSRQRWLHEGMFETYWSKSTYKKKKDMSDSSKSKETRPNMTKVGTCKMVVEPHIFDLTLFVIKDMSAPPPYPQNERPFVSYSSSPTQGVAYQTPSYQSPKMNSPLAPSTPVYGPPNTAPGSVRSIQSSTNNSYHTTPAMSSSTNPAPSAQHLTTSASAGSPISHAAAPNTLSQTVPMPRPTAAASSTPKQYSATPAAGINSLPKPQASPSLVTNRQSATNAQPASTGGTTTNRPAATSLPKPKPTPSRPISTQSTTQPTTKPAPAQDPVIQMLAHRAQNDNALKQVMKLVAAAQATPAQLTYFQGHIDELTKIAKERQEEERKKKAALELQKQSLVQRPQYTPLSAQGRSPLQQSTGPVQTPRGYNTPTSRLHTPNAHPSPRPVYQPSPASIQPRAPRPVYVPPPLHVLLEFSQNSTDRFLFPKNSILEYDSKGTSVLASFLIVKTETQLLNSESESKKTKKSEGKGKVKADVTPDASPANPPPNSDKKDTVAATEEDKKKSSEKPEKEFYQPVTVRFESPSDPTVLSIFGRVVAPVEQVQKYMLGVAEKAELGPTRHLALRLPRETKEIVISTADNSDHNAA